MESRSAALAARFRERMVDDLALLGGGETSGPRFEVAIHQLAGMAGMFGFAELGELAGVVEGQAHAGEVREEDVARLVAAIEAALRRG